MEKQPSTTPFLPPTATNEPLIRKSFGLIIDALFARHLACVMVV